MSRTQQLHKAMIERILKGKGHSSTEQRFAAFSNANLSQPLVSLIDKVANSSFKITDKDIASAKESGFTEDQIFELIISAAVGQSERQYESAIAALNKATANKKK
jgi:hypothetical protein